jgi:hypothetical protein
MKPNEAHCEENQGVRGEKIPPPQRNAFRFKYLQEQNFLLFSYLLNTFPFLNFWHKDRTTKHEVRCPTPFSFDALTLN